jgi:transposase
MARQFYRADYEAALDQTVTLREVLPEDHLARFLAREIATWDLTALYAKYADFGGPPFAPELLLGLLVYGYMTGVFSTRKLERATYESIPFRFLAGGFHPDHTTLAIFRQEMLPRVAALLAQVLVQAQDAGVWSLGPISQDGTKLHADASKHAAVSYQRCLELQEQLLTEVTELLRLAQQADQAAVPDGMDVAAEIQRRLERLTQLQRAQQVIEQRAAEREAQEQAAYQAKLDARAERERTTGKKPRGKPPTPPTPGPRAGDQYNFTDPDSRVMNNSTDQGFDQHFNAQVAVDQGSGLILAATLSNHPNDKEEAVPTLDAIAPEVGTPPAAALDNGFFSEANITAYEERQVSPYIATGKDTHHKSWQDYFAQTPEPPPDDASPTVKMAYALRTEIGRAIYRLRKCTVEPVIGIIKETLGFRQFSLRGLEQATGEWLLVCLAYELRRLYVLQASARSHDGMQSDQSASCRVHGACSLCGRYLVQQRNIRLRIGVWIFQGANG